ncbi:MAG: hypothetical protein WDA74_12430 [Spirochaetota bacterium]
MESKDYGFFIRIEWNISVQADSEEEAKKIVKDVFVREHNLNLDDENFILETEENNG